MALVIYGYLKGTRVYRICAGAVTVMVSCVMFASKLKLPVCASVTFTLSTVGSYQLEQTKVIHTGAASHKNLC